MYQPAGVDEEGRTLFAKVETHSPSESLNSSSAESYIQPMMQPPPIVAPQPSPQPPSSWQPFFIIQDGVISLSVRNLTYIGCILISAGITIMLIMACSAGIFCLLSCYYAYTVRQVNVRAWYRILYGITDDSTNSFIFWFGMVSVFTLPAIGFFDTHNFSTLHDLLAIGFFGSVAFYCLFLGNALQKNADKYPEHKNQIKQAHRMAYLLFSVEIAMAIGMGTHSWTGPFFEWCTAYLALNAVAFLASQNPYYDSIHPFGKLISPEGI